MNHKSNFFKQVFVISLAWLTCSTAIAEKTNKVITAENLATLQSVSQTQVSPSGEFIAYTRSVPRQLYVEKDGKNWSELYVVNEQGLERPFITGKVNIHNIQWSADSSLIFFLAKMNGDKYTTLYQIPANGGQAQKALALKATSITKYALSSDNKKIAILAKKAKPKSNKTLKGLGFKAEIFEEQLTNQFLYVTELNQSTQAITPEAWNIKGYVSDVHFSPTGKELLVKTQPTALIDDKYMKSQWHIVDISDKTVKTTFATAIPRGFPPKVEPCEPGFIVLAVFSSNKSAPIGNPPPIPLARATIFGFNSLTHSSARNLPVLPTPHCTSSKKSNRLFSLAIFSHF